MAKEPREPAVQRNANEGVISIIGPGMRIVGECETAGTVRIEGCVEGTIRAKKAVVVGREGTVIGEIYTQDAVIGGTVTGTLVAESRLELQESSRLEGEIRARRMRLDEGAIVNAQVHMGDDAALVTTTEALAADPPAGGEPPGPPLHQ
ncbi:MAG: polymer-forming cytoskeletal protein [Gemmatimonadetes bacterium]|nr:polymer-forming cytoskeletal protein [Gemmatimonadota bacterium]